MRRRLAGDGDGGFTLVELLLSMTLISMLVAPLSLAMVLGLNTFGEIEDSMVDANSRAFAARYVNPDVQSATGVTVDAPGATVACPDAGETDVMTLSGVPGGDVTYFLAQPAAGDCILFRRQATSVTKVVRRLRVGSTNWAVRATEHDAGYATCPSCVQLDVATVGTAPGEAAFTILAHRRVEV